MMLEMLLALALAQSPTPEPTPAPRPTPQPETRPSAYIEDRAPTDKKPFVTAAEAPEDYVADRARGTVVFDATRRNYSFHRVMLPAGPVTMRDSNFSQALAGTVTFWRSAGSGTAGALGVTGDLLAPNGYVPRAADRGCVVRVAPGRNRDRGRYRVTGVVGLAWRLERSAGEPLQAGIEWSVMCPVRDFTGITFERCNLVNVWIPSTAMRPTMVESNLTQADMP